MPARFVPLQQISAFIALGLLQSTFSHAATPKAWFKADSIDAADGEYVASWVDSSGTGNNAQISNNAPVLSSSGMNGRASVHFDGTDSLNFPRPVQDDFTIMVLFRTAAGTGSADNFYSGCGLVSGELPGFVNDFGMSIRDNGRVLAGTGNPDTTIRSNTGTNNQGYDNDQPHIATFTREKSTGAIALYVDQLVRRSGTGGTQSLSAPTYLTIGSHPGPVGPYLIGDIAEVIVWDGALGSSDQLIQENALRGKYGMSGGTAPMVPTSLSAVGAWISWDESLGAVSYNLYHATAATGPFTLLAGNLTSPVYKDTSPSTGQGTFYRITAVNPINESAPSAVVEGTSPPAPPAPTSVSAHGPQISWDESFGAASYRVYRADSAGGPFIRIAEDLTVNHYTDTTSTPGQATFYQITAVNTSGESTPSAIVEGSSPALPENGPVLINEIHYNGLDNSVHSDFVELFNFSTSAADISGWTLSKGIEFTFPGETVIPPGGYLVIAQDPTVVQNLWGVSALGPYAKSLGSDGDTIRLRDAAAAPIAEVTYSSGFPWPCAANGNGASAELANPALDPTLGSSWKSSVTTQSQLSREIASPGLQNFQFTLNPAPAIRDVSHLPLQPAAAEPITVTARIQDADGLATTSLSYQVVAPGNHIPAFLPIPIVNKDIDISQPRPANPAFENPANWTTLPMFDDATHGDVTAGDGIFTAVIPGQAHRSLVRYRISATDSLGASIRAPFADDASKNFAVFVYNGVPDYQGVPAATLKTLPVYQFLTRKPDYDQCVAYNYSDQLADNAAGRNFENWEATLVFDGVVYDHIDYRLHGGNGRYKFITKRSFRFFFNKGYDFQNRDNDGNLSTTKWNSLTTENGWENRGTLTYSLNEAVNFHLWNKIGIPAPEANWGHFRTITTAAEQTDAFHGDFWGLIFIHEDYDRRFIDSHTLEKGNLYKLTRDPNDGNSQIRYQAPDAVSDGSDHDNIYQKLKSVKGEAFIRRYVNVEKWSTYHALCQAVRHYDYWPTGDNNAAYYFKPDFTDQGPSDAYGKLWVLPNDVDATWGPTWNEGKDIVYESIFGSPANPGLYPTYFNAVREVRDLLFQPDQINPLLDQYAAVIAPFIAADSIRWKGAPNDAGNYNGLGGAGYTSLPNLVNDMKNFAWTGGSWPGGNVGPGGQSAFMDNLQLGVSNSEGSTMPTIPTITYQGPVGYPLNGLTFDTSNFSDPQGAGDFAAVQWRVAEVSDPAAPAYDPTAKVMLEWSAAFDSGPITTFANSYTFPISACQTGHAYRVRSRHQDLSGRWSHWSAPVQFIAGANQEDIPVVISEFLYKPSNPTAAEITAGFTDQEMFEYMELRNVGPEGIDLSGCFFDKGLTFIFPPGSTLAPNASTVIVANPAAFEFRFGTGRPIAGTYVGSLKNSGERILLTTAAGTSLVDFTYSDTAPWPTEPDTDGCSLVLINPDSRPEPNLPENWRASSRSGGAPGFVDDTSFATWAANEAVSGGPSDDDDQDGLSNILEYALVTDPHESTATPPGQLQSIVVEEVEGSYLTTSFLRRLDDNQLTYQVQCSGDCQIWENIAVLMESTDHHDGTATETWRAPLAAGEKGFLRIQVSTP